MRARGALGRFPRLDVVGLDGLPEGPQLLGAVESHSYPLVVGGPELPVPHKGGGVRLLGKGVSVDGQAGGQGGASYRRVFVGHENSVEVKKLLVVHTVDGGPKSHVGLEATSVDNVDTPFFYWGERP